MLIFIAVKLPLSPTPSRRGRLTRGFTLIELLIVIAIIAILAGIGFPAIQGAMDTARRGQARNDVHQVASAMKAYFLEYGQYPEIGEAISKLTGDNPKSIIFLEAKKASGTPPKGGLSEDGTQLLNAWGKPVEVTEVNYDKLPSVVVRTQVDPDDTTKTISNID